jgi:ferredoxin-type protein NapH
MNWLKDKTKRISIIRTIVQLLFLFLIFYVSIVAVWKGLLLVIIIGSTLFLGRLFCGWVCPLGLYQDMMTLLRRLLRIRHWSLPRKVNEDLHEARYLIALVILVVVLSATLLATSFDIGNFVTLRPPFTVFAFLLEPLQPIVLPWHPPFGALAGVGGVYLTFPYVGEILLYLRDTGFALPLSYLFVVAVLAASFKVRRFWCRFCPTGISIAALNRFKHFKWAPLLRLSKDGEKCTKCGICQRVCPVQVTEVYEKKTGPVDTSMCMLCLRCIEMCPEKECLSLKAAGQTIYRSRNWLNRSS